MLIDTTLGDLETAARDARKAEDTGYAGAFTGEVAAKPHGYGMPAVLLAGVGDAMTRMAGEVADGFLCHGFTTGRWIREHTLPALEEGRRRAGKTMDGFTVKAAVFLATGTEEETARAAAQIRSSIAFYASTPAYKPILDLHGWGEAGAELTRLSREGRWDEMDALVTDDMLYAFAIVAPPEQVPGLLAQRCAGVVNRVSFLVSAPSPDLLAAIRLDVLEPESAH
jgi:probable F420-dependent oxidoreductase